MSLTAPFLPHLRLGPTLLVALTAQLIWAPVATAQIDIFNVGSQVSATVLRGAQQKTDQGCDTEFAATQDLSLALAIELALCRNPQTRRAWAYAKSSAAQLGLAKAGYLPSLNASGVLQKQKSTTQVEDSPIYDQNINSSLRSGRVDLSMVLFDFGARSANLESAQALLAAANLSHDAAIQGVFITAAANFYAASTAQSSVLAMQASKHSAQESFRAADARMQIGLGTQVEKLQAETAFAQESLKLVKAEGALQDALGVLAATMAMPANTPLKLARVDETNLPDSGFVKSVESLMEDAKLSHPGLAAARAQLRSAQAGEKIARASGLPTLSLTASNSRANQPTTQLGLPSSTTASHGTQVGVQLSIPLGDVVSRAYRVRQAMAQTEAKAADLTEVELQVSVEVWKNYQALHTASEELKVSEQYRFSAAKSVDASRGRYLAGATEILELLNAQATLANAQQARIQATADWRIARLRLAYSLGRLGSLAL